MKKLAGGVSVLTVLALLVIAAVAGATPATLATTTVLAPGSLGPVDVQMDNGDWKLRLKTRGHSDVATSEIRVAPGGQLGWHRHPGPSLVIVKSGTSTFYSGDDPHCIGEAHPAGTAYLDPGGDVHIARNEGTQELVLIVTRIIPAGATPRVDVPAPGNCPF